MSQTIFDKWKRIPSRTLCYQYNTGNFLSCYVPKVGYSALVSFQVAGLQSCYWYQYRPPIWRYHSDKYPPILSTHLPTRTVPWRSLPETLSMRRRVSIQGDLLQEDHWNFRRISLPQRILHVMVGIDNSTHRSMSMGDDSYTSPHLVSKKSMTSEGKWWQRYDVLLLDETSSLHRIEKLQRSCTISRK